MSTYMPFTGGEQRTTPDGRTITMRPVTRDRYASPTATKPLHFAEHDVGPAQAFR